MRHDLIAMKSPCDKNCSDRVIGCHSKCKKYKEFRNKIDEINNKRIEYWEKKYGRSYK